MRFVRFAAVMLFLFGVAVAVEAAVSAHTPSKLRAADPVIAGGPKAWALATTALLAYRNGDRIDMLAPNARNDSTISQTRDILRDWWGIDNRSDLIHELDRLAQAGHRADFQRLWSMTDGGYRALLRATRDRSSKERMKLMRLHYQKHHGSSLVAWDYSRYIMLCRWGYMVGFLNEEESWRRVMPAARTIQDSFHSWAELGEDYLVGREYWSREETARTGRIYREIESWLLKAPRSPWRHLPWSMELGRA
jgi:Protein of unknown function (DUF1266)